MIDSIIKPRSWSSKYWANNDISDVLREVVEPDDVDISTIEMHDELCPLIWDLNQNNLDVDNNQNSSDITNITNYQLKKDIRKVLLLNAKRFIEFSDVENLKFNDIILTGSMANFNYNENSDLDVHIILDFNQISDNKDFVGSYFKLKKQLWTDNLPIQVKGYDVEMYFQDEKEPHHSSGVYSLIKNKWIRKPTKKIINIDTADVQLKSADIMNTIDDLETNKSESNFIKKHEQLKNKIKKYRQAGLDKKGEYSIENLVFKILRNTGYLEKMVDLKNNYLKDELTLDEILN